MVDLDLPKLYARGLSPADVSTALNAQNVILPAGMIKIGDREYDVRTNSSPETLDALMSWWGGVLRDGELRLQGEPPIPWRDEWPTSLLFRAYMDAARSDTDLPPVSPVLFGRFLAYVEGRQVRLPEAFPGHRPYGYRFGRVERARKSLQRVTDAQKP